MSIWSSAWRVFHKEGAVPLIKRSKKYIYNNLVKKPYNDKIRSRLPRSDREREYNSVKVRPHRKFDQFIPIRPFANQGGHKYPEEYEHRLIKALRKWSGADDRVVIVGGGLGVTSVVAARKVGENGQVITFEGAKDMAEIARETVRLNAVDERVTVKHAIVGSALQLAGEAGGADCVSPEEIPDSDILELDCEGAEVDILKNISTRPRAIIAETHNNIEKVRQVLEGGLCYDIVSEEIAEIGPYTDMCERNDICVIVATD